MGNYSKNTELENIVYFNEDGVKCTEVFKDIPEYEGLYQASDLGRIKSLNKKGRILRQYLEKRGYFTVVLHKKSDRGKTKPVHQLIAITFLNHKPCGMKLVVNHKNFIRIDNRLENLEIVTNRQNTDHKHLESTSKYTGVNLNKDGIKWRASISFNQSKIYLGTFDTEEEASEYYENAVKAIEKGEEIKVKRKQYSSQYKGVSLTDKGNKWRARLKIDGKEVLIGCYLTELEAHLAYEEYKNKLNK